MPSATKIALAVAGIGTVGVGVGFGVHMLNSVDTNSLKFKLVAEGFDTAISSTEWEEIFAEYNKDLNRNVFQIKSRETKNKEWLERKCTEILNKEDKQNTNYDLAIQWCVKPEKISDILSKENSKFKLLNTVDTETEADKSDWKGKISSLGTTDNSGAKSKLEVTLGAAEEANIKEIKGKCREIKELKTTSQGFKEKFDLAKKWCSIAK